MLNLKRFYTASQVADWERVQAPRAFSLGSGRVRYSEPGVNECFLSKTRCIPHLFQRFCHDFATEDWEATDFLEQQGLVPCERENPIIPTSTEIHYHEEN
ncbi:hypothetical protein IEN85_22890 [Pelagicoccus sp. NFK12]|uniref:Uncharacterized protein n=1 Tax=Pelagicoccus enzymogenes TaxID=2773457 RepID=A0A927FDI4_9BACT|nr:hypothetical protein [Pelagicoccus enzymogenes]MBD5782365.1 hypothetical protein [Pelagicoccus enzymogenes]